jgi:drug/metabolite transporter (DMT)-like permease
MAAGREIHAMKPPLILGLIGLVIVLLAGLATLVTFVLMATSNGRISPEEAAPFLGGGCCCSGFGMIAAVGGLIWWLATRNPPHAPNSR